MYAMCIGMTATWDNRPILSAATKHRPNLTKLLCAFAKHDRPDYEFTSIQVNKDYAAALHVDGNNSWDSIIVGLGDYAGGQLWVDTGRTAHGTLVDVHNRWHRFCGAHPHCVLPFTGRRYTLVYFTRARGRGGVCAQHAEEPQAGESSGSGNAARATRLLELGFPLPRALMEEPLAQLPSRQRIAAAEVRFDALRACDARCDGPGHVVLRLRFPRGEVHRVSVDTTAPFRLLLAAVAERLLAEASALRLVAQGGLELLPSDTLRGLGIGSGHLIDVVVEAGRPVVVVATPKAAAVRATSVGAGQLVDVVSAPKEERVLVSPSCDNAPPCKKARCETVVEDVESYELGL